MALPLILAGIQLAISVGSAIAQHVGQNRQSSGTKDAANASAAASHAALSGRAIEERLAAGQSLEQGERQAMSSAALARLSAIEAGVAGNSALAIEQGIGADLGTFRSSVKTNLDLSLLQIDRARSGVEAERQSHIAGTPRASNALLGLRIGTAGLDFASSEYQRRNPS